MSRAKLPRLALILCAGCGGGSGNDGPAVTPASPPPPAALAALGDAYWEELMGHRECPLTMLWTAPQPEPPMP